MSDELHVVFGAGQVGSRLATQLLQSGKRVRIVKRAAASVPGAEMKLGDALDPEFCLEAAHGATSVYHCMNPAYDAKVWASVLPRYADNLIAAAGKAGARLIVLNNLYMLGRTGGRPMNEDTPMNPCSKKGEIRARVSQQLFDAHRRGDVRAAEGRAADFYGPGGQQTYIGDYFWKPALAGRTVQLPVDPDELHTYHYIPDVAAGLASLGSGSANDSDLGRAWMLPCQPVDTLRTLVDRLSQMVGRTIRIAKVPRWVIRLSGIFVPLFREVDEMLYQWEEPFIVDDRRFRERFGTQPTDLMEAARTTVEWAKQHYAQSS
jgi:nucleoside-diphosphate-sugar epimerase